MRIGVDIDGVVCDSYPSWLGELNRHYGKEIKELHSYEMHLLFEVPYEDMNNFFVENVEHLFTVPQPMPGVKKALEIIRREHQVYLVTARRPEEEEITRKWLVAHEIPFDELMMVGDRRKWDVCKEHKLEMFIEDYAGNAIGIAQAGLPVIIFDAPYNRDQLPDGIKRCYNWGQVLQRIKELQFSTGLKP